MDQFEGVFSSDQRFEGGGHQGAEELEYEAFKRGLPEKGLADLAMNQPDLANTEQPAADR